MITSIIFSKDRPLQLDLCLGSIEKNFPDSNNNIVIHNSSEEFKPSYGVVKSEHPNAQLWLQGASLFGDVYTAIAASENEYICFFTDDIICYRPVVNIDYNIFSDPEVSCVSLRMGVNITERFCEGELYTDVPPQAFALNDNMIIWCRTNNLYGSYWSYNLSVDGHIFRKNDLLEMMGELVYMQPIKKWKQTPNELESALQRFWTISPNMIAAPKHSAVVNSPNNRVQDTCHNRSGDTHNYEAEYLLGKYISGARVNLEYLDFGNIKCPHTEIDILKGITT
tara:strand:- start:756 stop:1598 length:843 start_codon:yes stop_codon:yes gene_type:complete